MQKLIITTLLTLFTLNASGQKIVRDEVDRFTKISVKETSREMLHLRGLKSVLRYDMRKTGDNISLGIWLSLKQPYGIPDGGNLYLLLEDETSILLNCIGGGVATDCSSDYCMDRFAYGIPLMDVYKLLDNRIVAIRMDFTGGEYMEFDDIKEKNAEKFIRSLKLIAK